MVQQINSWMENISEEINSQMKLLGTSMDFSKKRFLNDPVRSKFISDCFVDLYKQGLIYRTQSIVNWCNRCETSLSDMELELKEEYNIFYRIRYEFEDCTGSIEILTKSPETMWGDEAIAVHPNDERYKNFVGKHVTVPIINKTIPIISEDFVETDFGTGAIRITPAHNPKDFEIAKKNNFNIISVISKQGNMDIPNEYSGVEQDKYRKIWVKNLEYHGYLIDETEIGRGNAYCYRCGTQIRPRLSNQWFLKVQELIPIAISEIKKKNFKFVPERYKHNYLNWINELDKRIKEKQSWWEGGCIAIQRSLSSSQDWCISRQIWWGNEIPALICKECNNVMVSKNNINYCERCGSDDIDKEQEVLDMWFSCALAAYSASEPYLNETKLLSTNMKIITVTGVDLIDFWIGPSVLLGVKIRTHAPYSEALIHGLVTDENGKKMSKSLGNVIEIDEVIEKYGADSLRLSLIDSFDPIHESVLFSVDKVRRFNLWLNLLMNKIISVIGEKGSPLNKPKEVDKKINNIQDNYINCMERYELRDALNLIINFVDQEIINSTNIYYNLNQIKTILQFIQPFAPFIVEELISLIQQKI